MCRFALYAGPATSLSTLLYDPPHSLERQAYAPREMQHGTVNVDGTGVAWWPPDEDEPLRYVTVAPPWADPNLPSLAPRLQGRTILAAVRGATPGIGFGHGAVAPFLLDGLAFVHNGWIGGFRSGVGAALLRPLPDELVGSLETVSDSTVLLRTVVGHRRAGRTLPDAVATTLGEVAAQCVAAGQVATLNLGVTDGVEHVAVRASVGLPGNSLYVCDHLDGGQLTVASEPLDDRAWTGVPDGTLVHLHDGRLDHLPLPLREEPAP